jgi:hypothetical protein
LTFFIFDGNEGGKSVSGGGGRRAGRAAAQPGCRLPASLQHTQVFLACAKECKWNIFNEDQIKPKNAAMPTFLKGKISDHLFSLFQIFRFCLGWVVKVENLNIDTQFRQKMDKGVFTSTQEKLPTFF